MMFVLFATACLLIGQISGQTLPPASVPNLYCPSPDGNFPNPSNDQCTSYFQCAAGVPTLLRCAANQVFDFLFQECRPQAQVNCTRQLEVFAVRDNDNSGRPAGPGGLGVPGLLGGFGGTRGLGTELGVNGNGQFANPALFAILADRLSRGQGADGDGDGDGDGNGNNNNNNNNNNNLALIAAIMSSFFNTIPRQPQRLVPRPAPQAGPFFPGSTLPGSTLPLANLGQLKNNPEALPYIQPAQISNQLGNLMAALLCALQEVEKDFGMKWPVVDNDALSTQISDVRDKVQLEPQLSPMQRTRGMKKLDDLLVTVQETKTLVDEESAVSDSEQ